MFQDEKKLGNKVMSLQNEYSFCKSMLGLPDAAIYLGIAKSTLYKHTSSGRITYYKPNGKLIWFKKDDLDRWLESKKFSPTQNLNNKDLLKVN